MPSDSTHNTSVDPKGMRAIILVGGYGTRLRPLTFTKPKPLVPFCNKPMIIHQVEALKEAGVTEVILAVAYRPDAMKDEMDKWSKEIGVSFVFSLEDEPLGTAGPLALARDILEKDDQPFFMLNSDVTCRFPLKQLLAFHKSHGKEGTIMVTKVVEWQKYGVVMFDETNCIQQFAEKPDRFVSDKINAGIYVFNKSILNRIPKEKCSIEKQIFPVMAASKELYAYDLEGFWMDVGQPRDFIDGMGKFLSSRFGTANGESTLCNNNNNASQSGFTTLGCVIIHPSAKIGEGTIVGPNVSIGANCVIGPHCRIENAAIFEGTTIGCGTFVSRSIVGWSNRIGKWCHIEGLSVFGDDVDTSDGLFINGLKALPNKSITHHHKEPEIVM